MSGRGLPSPIHSVGFRIQLDRTDEALIGLDPLTKSSIFSC
jgi:hypothetical protein